MNSYLWTYKKELREDQRFLKDLKSYFNSELEVLTKGSKDKNYFMSLYSILSAPPHFIKEEITTILACIKKQKAETTRNNEFALSVIALLNENFLEHKDSLGVILDEILLPLGENPDLFNFQNKLKILMQMAKMNYKNPIHIHILVSVREKNYIYLS